MGLKKWLKVGAIAVLAVACTIILVQRAYLRYNNAHLVVDGRVVSDFKLYFGPRGRLLLRIGVKPTRRVFVYEPLSYGTIDQVLDCPARDVWFPPFVAVVASRRGCTMANEEYEAWSRGNALFFKTRDGHTYEVSWQAPAR